MFFVAKEKIGTTLGSQKEYTAATRRGISFVSHGNVWHYLWPADMLERSIREQHEPQQQQSEEDSQFGYTPYRRHITHYIWSQEVGPGEIIGEPVIKPYSGEGDWVTEAQKNFTEEMAARRAAAAH